MNYGLENYTTLKPEAACSKMAELKSWNFGVNVGRDVVARVGYENVMVGKEGQVGNVFCCVKCIAQSRRKRAETAGRERKVVQREREEGKKWKNKRVNEETVPGARGADTAGESEVAAATSASLSLWPRWRQHFFRCVLASLGGGQLVGCSLPRVQRSKALPSLLASHLIKAHDILSCFRWTSVTSISFVLNDTFQTLMRFKRTENILSVLVWGGRRLGGCCSALRHPSHASLVESWILKLRWLFLIHNASCNIHHLTLKVWKLT